MQQRGTCILHMVYTWATSENHAVTARMTISDDENCVCGGTRNNVHSRRGRTGHRPRRPSSDTGHAGASTSPYTHTPHASSMISTVHSVQTRGISCIATVCVQNYMYALGKVLVCVETKGPNRGSWRMVVAIQLAVVVAKALC